MIIRLLWYYRKEIVDPDRSICVVLAHRLHGNVGNLGVLSYRRDEGQKGQDAVILTFRDAKVSVLEFDDATHGLRIG